MVSAPRRNRTQNSSASVAGFRPSFSIAEKGPLVIPMSSIAFSLRAYVAGRHAGRLPFLLGAVDLVFGFLYRRHFLCQAPPDPVKADRSLDGEGLLPHPPQEVLAVLPGEQDAVAPFPPPGIDLAQRKGHRSFGPGEEV